MRAPFLPTYHHHNDHLTAVLSRGRSIGFLTGITFVVMIAFMTFVGWVVTLDTEPPTIADNEGFAISMRRAK